jgi:hypothetical protein
MVKIDAAKEKLLKTLNPHQAAYCDLSLKKSTKWRISSCFL